MRQANEKTLKLIPASPGFDPLTGCQKPSTGILGGIFLLLLTAFYIEHSLLLLEYGETPVLNVPGWLPVYFRTAIVYRYYFDLLAIIVLSFQFMLGWQFFKQVYSRFLILLVAIVGVWGAFVISNGGVWIFHDQAGPFPDWGWYLMEFWFLGISIGFIMIWFTAVLLSFWNKGFPGCSPLFWVIKTSFFRWLTGLLFFTIFLFIVFAHPFYQGDFYEKWRVTLTLLYSLYLFLGFPYAFITSLLRGHRFEDRSDPGFTLMMISYGIVRGIKDVNSSRFKRMLRNRRVLVVLRDLLVKIFFVPLMLVFIFNEFKGLQEHLPAMIDGLKYHYIAGKVLFDEFYWSVYHSLFFMDVGLAFIGYLVSSRWLDNKSRSVDPSVLGWMVTLACYPPFNSITGQYLPYEMAAGAPFLIFQTEWLDILLKSIALIFFSLYVWATMAFGLRFSNLTHRGIITRGPYAFVRHPAYIAKTLAWWAASIPLFTDPRQYLFLLAFNFVYYLRVMTEERHLGQDADYQTYCTQVKYKFIPKIW